VDLEQHPLQPIHLTTILGLQHHLHQPAVDGQPLPPTNLHSKNSLKKSTNHPFLIGDRKPIVVRARKGAPQWEHVITGTSRNRRTRARKLLPLIRSSRRSLAASAAIRSHISITKISRPFVSTSLIAAKSALAASLAHAHNTNARLQLL